MEGSAAAATVITTIVVLLLLIAFQSLFILQMVAKTAIILNILIVIPSLVYLPKRGPSTMAPAKAAHPPTECTMVEPAKS